MSPDLYIIAGPNGAGKTTFAKKFLPFYADCRNFINADLIAQGVAPFSPEAVAFRALRRQRPMKLPLNLPRARAAGFTLVEIVIVSVIFVFLILAIVGLQLLRRGSTRSWQPS